MRDPSKRKQICSVGCPLFETFPIVKPSQRNLRDRPRYPDFRAVLLNRVVGLFRGGNGIAITTGDGVESGSIKVQVGSDTDQTVDLQLVDLQVTNTEIIGTTVAYTYNSANVTTGSTRDTVSWSSIVDNSAMSVNTQNSIGKIAHAINFIANARARLGAQQNRMEQTKSALLSYEDNLRASESKIRDVDMAFETTQFSKYQILTQVGNSMLAQANQLPQQVLQLLG